MTTPKDAAKTADKAAKTRKKASPKQRKSAQKTKEPKKVGRKPWVPDYAKIEMWASQGLFDKQIAALCGINESTFYEKKAEIPELIATLERGRAKGAAACAQMVLSMALKGDRDLLKFYLERRSGWKNTTVLETLPKPVEEMTPEELLAIVNGKQIS